MMPIMPAEKIKAEVKQGAEKLVLLEQEQVAIDEEIKSIMMRIPKDNRNLSLSYKQTCSTLLVFLAFTIYI